LSNMSPALCVSGLPPCIREEEDTCVCVHVLACVFQVFPPVYVRRRTHVYAYMCWHVCFRSSPCISEEEDICVCVQVLACVFQVFPPPRTPTHRHINARTQTHRERDTLKDTGTQSNTHGHKTHTDTKPHTFTRHKHIYSSQTHLLVTNTLSQTHLLVTNTFTRHKHIYSSQTHLLVTNTFTRHKHIYSSQTHCHKHIYSSQTHLLVTNTFTRAL
jgi:hypothetical protein